MKNYTVNYFLEKFEKIPEEQWTTGTYHRDFKFCALGFCTPTYYDYYGCRPDDLGEWYEILRSNEQDALYALFSNHIGISPIHVNDGGSKRYPQFTPKERIMAALRDIKQKQEEEAEKSLRAAAILKAKHMISEPIKTEQYELQY